MAKGGFTVDDSQFRMMMRNLTGDQIKRSYRAGLRKAAQILKKENDRSYESETGLHTRKELTSEDGRTVKRSDAGVARIRTYFRKGQMPYAIISIEKDYMMRWFERGTKRRNTRGRKVVGMYRKGNRRYKIRVGKGRYTGVIEPMRIFQRSQNITESKVIASIKNMIKQEIAKAYKRAI